MKQSGFLGNDKVLLGNRKYVGDEHLFILPLE